MHYPKTSNVHNVLKIDQPGAFAWGNYEGFDFVESGRFRDSPKISFTICKELETGKFWRLCYITPKEDVDDETTYYHTKFADEVELQEVEVKIKVKDWMIKGNSHESD